MICVELAFDGNPARLELRPGHRELLNRLHHEGALVMAGPWHDESGALLVFDLDEAGVRAALENDPYYSAPGVEIVSIKGWDPIVGGP